MDKATSIKISKDIVEYGRSAKAFCEEAGEGTPSDEHIMRAAVAFSMLERRGMIAKIRVDGDMTHEVDDFDRAFAVAMIAINYDDNPPSTPERVELFAQKI